MQNIRNAVEQENSWLDAARLSEIQICSELYGSKFYWRREDNVYGEAPDGTAQYIDYNPEYSSMYPVKIIRFIDSDPNGYPMWTTLKQMTRIRLEDEIKKAIKEAKQINKTIQKDNKLKNNMAKNVDSNKAVTLVGLDNKTVVNCTTQELANKVTALAESAGLTWINGKKYSDGNKWEIRGAKSCYQLTSGLVHTIEYFTSEGFKVLTAEEFLEMNTVKRKKVPNVKLTPEQMEFNLDRLAASSDIVFKEQLVVKKQEFNTSADSTALEVLGELKEKVTRIKDDISADFTKEVNDVLTNSKEMLLEELRKGRTTINVNTGSAAVSYTISTEDHYMMETVFKSLLLHKKILMAGEAGTGKTYMAAQMAEKLKISFYKYSCSRDSSVHDLLGYKQPRSETYLSTTFLNAYENGGVFLVDEYDAMPGDVALFFNGIADSSKSISIPHRDDNPIAKKHKDFYLIMCGNTWGKGSQDYSGRDFQDMALLDRFRLCRHHIGYDANLEKSMIGETMYSFAVELRALMTKLGSYLSTRNVEDIALLLRGGETLDHVLKTMAADLEEVDKSEFSRANLAVKHQSSFDKFMREINPQISRGATDKAL